MRTSTIRSPRWLRVVLGIGVAVLGTLAFIGYRDLNDPRLGRVMIEVAGLSREVRILHISDLHGARFGEGQARLAELLGESRYDIAVFTGDHVRTPKDDASPALELARIVGERAKLVVGVRGNHDGDRLPMLLSEAGVRQLESGDVTTTGEPSASEVAVVGADCRHEFEMPEDAEDYPVIVAAGHIPPQGAVLESLSAPREAVVLALAGHTHGGQLRLPFIGALWAPYEWETHVIPPQTTGFLPDLRGRFVKGHYRRDALHVHVSPGLGWSFLPLRLFDRAEMTEIVLVPKR